MKLLSESKGVFAARLFVSLALSLGLALIAASCGSPANVVRPEPPRIDPAPPAKPAVAPVEEPPEPRIIRVGHSKFAYPPLHYSNDSGDLIGFDVELAKAAAALMGVEFAFVPIDWSKRADQLTGGEVDLLWGGLERASLDERVIKFTKSYLRSNIVLLMKEGCGYTRFEDLHGLSVCALNFTPAFYYLQAYNRDVIQSRRSFTPPDYEELRDALSSAEFDCMITDTSFAPFFLETADPDCVMSDSLIGSNYAVALRSSDADLFDQLQNALDELEADGTIARLAEKWINR